MKEINHKKKNLSSCLCMSPFSDNEVSSKVSKGHIPVLINIVFVEKVLKKVQGLYCINLANIHLEIS